MLTARSAWRSVKSVTSGCPNMLYRMALNRLFKDNSLVGSAGASVEDLGTSFSDSEELLDSVAFLMLSGVPGVTTSCRVHT